MFGGKEHPGAFLVLRDTEGGDLSTLSKMKFKKKKTGRKVPGGVLGSFFLFGPPTGHTQTHTLPRISRA